jgi:hypothetical protein
MSGKSPSILQKEQRKLIEDERQAGRPLSHTPNGPSRNAKNQKYPEHDVEEE